MTASSSDARLPERLPVEDPTLSFQAAFVAGGLGVGWSMLAAIFSVVAKYAVAQRDNPRLSAAVFFGVITATILGTLVVRRKLPGRTGAVACLATLGWMPIVLFGIAVFHEPLVTSHVRCGTGQMAAIIMGPVVLVPLLVVSSLVATTARLPRFDRLLRVGARTSIVIVGVATALALGWSTRPDPDTYLASLPVTRLAVGEALKLSDGTMVRYARRPVTAQGPLAGPACSLEGIEGASLGCKPLQVSHDPHIQLWLLTGPDQEQLAFFEKDRRVRTVDSAAVATVVGPPIAWTVGGLIGFGIAVVVAARARQIERGVSEADGVEGVADRDGWVTVAGGPPVHLPGATPGPVVLLLRTAQGAAYRDASPGDVTGWQPGTLADARASIASRAASLYALAMTSALLCAAPLLLSGLGGAR